MLSCLSIQGDRFTLVLFNATTTLVGNAEIVLRDGVTLLGCLPIPGDRLTFTPEGAGRFSWSTEA